MNQPDSPEPTGPNSPTQLRNLHLELLKQLEVDGQKPSRELLAKVEAFQASAKATGAIIISPEERSDVQSTINFWMNIMYNNGLFPETILIDDFDPAAAGKMIERSSPYNGLKPFQIDDSKFFFGRSEALRQMQGILEKKRLLAVTGLSGSGKSSVVRGGLLPRMLEGAVSGSEDWLYLDPIMPGTDPVASLEKLTGSKIDTADNFVAWLESKEQAVVISVDQFEEAYTLSADAEPPALFLDALVAAIDPDTKFHHRIIITIRSEFDDNVTGHEALNKLFRAGRVRLDALTENDLREVIELPAKQFGVDVEVELVHELVQRMVGVTAGLPLLEFTLQELWRMRQGGPLKYEDYKSLGGDPRIILTDRADEVYESLLPQQQRQTKDIFLKLIKIEDMDAKSRRMKRAEITAPRDDTDVVLDIWRKKGFLRISPDGLITPDSEIEVAHEALIRNWRRFEDWIRDGLREHLNLSAFQNRAERWKDNGSQISDELLGLSEIAEAEGLLEKYEESSPDLQEFVRLSRAEVDKQEERQRKKKKGWQKLARQIYSTGLIYVIPICFVLAGSIFFPALETSEIGFYAMIAIALIGSVLLLLRALRVVGSDLIEAASTISFIPSWTKKSQSDSNLLPDERDLPFYKRAVGYRMAFPTTIFSLILIGMAPLIISRTYFENRNAEQKVDIAALEKNKSVLESENQELEKIVQERTEIFSCNIQKIRGNDIMLSISAPQIDHLRYDFGPINAPDLTMIGPRGKVVAKAGERVSDISYFSIGGDQQLTFQIGKTKYVVYSHPATGDNMSSGVFVIDKNGITAKKHECKTFQEFNVANFDLSQLPLADELKAIPAE